MNKIVNSVANDYMFYESNIMTTRDKDSVTAMTYINQDKEITRLNNIINKYDEKIQMLDSVCRSLEFSAPENDYIFKERLREIIDKLKELKENK